MFKLDLKMSRVTRCRFVLQGVLVFGSALCFPLAGFADDLNHQPSPTVPWAEITHQLGVVESLPAGRLAKPSLDKLNEIGEALFSAQFTPADGAGRPNATHITSPYLAGPAISLRMSLFPKDLLKPILILSIRNFRMNAAVTISWVRVCWSYLPER